jgi:hypothetical protein
MSTGVKEEEEGGWREKTQKRTIPLPKYKKTLISWLETHVVSIDVQEMLV